jgi:hypothetical protein
MSTVINLPSLHNFFIQVQRIALASAKFKPTQFYLKTKAPIPVGSTTFSKRQRHQLSRMADSPDGHNDVLLAIHGIGHGQAGLIGG